MGEIKRAGAAPAVAGVTALLASVVALACVPSAQARGPLRPAARLAVDAAMVGVGAAVRVDPRASCLPQAGGPASTLSFGDHTKRVRLRRLAVRIHRYRKAGRYTITLTVRSGGRALTARRTVTVGKRTVKATPAAGTLVASDADVASVTGDPSTRQTVILAAGAPAPRPGGILALPASRDHPEGLLGRVTAVAHQPDGRTPADPGPFHPGSGLPHRRGQDGRDPR